MQPWGHRDYARAAAEEETKALTPAIAQAEVAVLPQTASGSSAVDGVERVQPQRKGGMNERSERSPRREVFCATSPKSTRALLPAPPSFFPSKLSLFFPSSSLLHPFLVFLFLLFFSFPLCTETFPQSRQRTGLEVPGPAGEENSGGMATSAALASLTIHSTAMRMFRAPRRAVREAVEKPAEGATVADGRETEAESLRLECAVRD